MYIMYGKSLLLYMITSLAHRPAEVHVCACTCTSIGGFRPNDLKDLRHMHPRLGIRRDLSARGVRFPVDRLVRRTSSRHSS